MSLPNYVLPVIIAGKKEKVPVLFIDKTGEVSKHPKSMSLARDIYQLLLTLDKFWSEYFTYTQAAGPKKLEEAGGFVPNIRNPLEPGILLIFEDMGDIIGAKVTPGYPRILITINIVIARPYLDGSNPHDFLNKIRHELTHVIHETYNPTFKRRIKAIRMWGTQRGTYDEKAIMALLEDIKLAHSTNIATFKTDYDWFREFLGVLLSEFLYEGLAWYAGECERNVSVGEGNYAVEGVEELKRFRELFIEYELKNDKRYLEEGEKLYLALTRYLYSIGAHMVGAVIDAGLANLEQLMRIGTYDFVKLYEKACDIKKILPLVTLSKNGETHYTFDYGYSLRKIWLAKNKNL